MVRKHLQGPFFIFFFSSKKKGGGRKKNRTSTLPDRFFTTHLFWATGEPTEKRAPSFVFLHLCLMDFFRREILSWNKAGNFKSIGIFFKMVSNFSRFFQRILPKLKQKNAVPDGNHNVLNNDPCVFMVKWRGAAPTTHNLF